MKDQKPTCPECAQIDRRRFVKACGTAVAAAGVSSVLFDSRFAHAAPSPTSAAETAVARFYTSLTEQQRQVVCLPFDHDARHRISANWHVTEPLIGDDFFTKEQRATIDEILRNVTTEDGYARLQQQMDDDDGGMDNYSVAVFGKPGEGKFQWEMTGRHLTLRADGNSVDRAAFGGPIVYGHGEEDPKANLFHYQTKKANEVFQSLDTKQREIALLEKAPRETAVQIQGEQAPGFPGIRVEQLASDQKELVEQTIKQLLAPYRQEDVDEVISILKRAGGLDALHMAFYRQGDLDDDQVWDIWRLEGPSLVWHFRGAPHVHAYINIGTVS